MGGGVSDALTPQMQRDGIKLPDNIRNQPRLAANLLGYLDAFYELDTERSHQMGLMRIPWSRIVAYAQHYGMDVDETVVFIRRMDDALLADMRKKRPGNNGGSQGPSTVVERPPRPD